MNKNKIKIKKNYIPSYSYEEVEEWKNEYYLRKYNKTLIDYLISAKKICPDQVINEYSYFDKYYPLLCFIRHKSHFKLLLKQNEICKEFGVKGISKETVAEYDPWNDDKISSYRDRKSWKRNSKRKHQWKEL